MFYKSRAEVLVDKEHDARRTKKGREESGILRRQSRARMCAISSSISFRRLI
jgi:hypothetical protein